LRPKRLPISARVARLLDRPGVLAVVGYSNECGTLIANVVIAYNSILLSMLLNRCQTAE